MQEGYVNLNGVPTKAITYGKWIEDGFGEDERKDIILCIPGNPGVTTAYRMFLESLHQQTGCVVWIVGHAGHEITDAMPPLKNNEHLFNLQGQIDHKITFIEKYVPKDANLRLIGHSIGAYIILKLLKIPSIASLVRYNYFLFPTIEYMAETRNGFLMTKLLRSSYYLLLFWIWTFAFMPRLMQNVVLYFYLKLQGIPSEHFETVRSLFDPYVMKNVSAMGMDEMHTVRGRDDEILQSNIKKIKLYYGSSDGWVPVAYYEKIKKEIPDIDAELCVRDFAHAFVLRDSKAVANMVAAWINEEKCR